MVTCAELEVENAIGETMPNVILSALVTLILKLSHTTNQPQPIADVLRKVASLMDGA